MPDTAGSNDGCGKRRSHWVLVRKVLGMASGQIGFSFLGK